MLVPPRVFGQTHNHGSDVVSHRQRRPVARGDRFDFALGLVLNALQDLGLVVARSTGAINAALVTASAATGPVLPATCVDA